MSRRPDFATYLQQRRERVRSCVVEDANGCWIWQAASKKGYGVSSWLGRFDAAHRVSYRAFVGPIPEGLQIDHLCRVPMCVNPAHLEPVTARENTIRGTSFAAQNARKERCIRGHDDWVRDSRGRRRCRTCSREAPPKCEPVGPRLCRHCGRDVRSLSNLRRHEPACLRRVKMAARPSSCRHCGVALPRPQLSRHEAACVRPGHVYRPRTDRARDTESRLRIRAWANANGMACASVGRIPRHVLVAYAATGAS